MHTHTQRAQARNAYDTAHKRTTNKRTTPKRLAHDTNAGSSLCRVLQPLWDFRRGELTTKNDGYSSGSLRDWGGGMVQIGVRITVQGVVRDGPRLDPTHTVLLGAHADPR